MDSASSPDATCRRYAERARQVSLSIGDLDSEYVLIKGSKLGLQFLRELLLAQAEANDTGYQLSPMGPGEIYFSPGSTRGLYIERTK